MMSTSNPESHTTPATSLESDRINELAWKSFAAFINSGSSGDPSDPNGDTFKDEPDEDDYIRYFDFLWEAKNYKSPNLWSTFLGVSRKHQQNYGKDMRYLWPIIAEMCDDKKKTKVQVEDVNKSAPEKTRKKYEREWELFKDFINKGRIENTDNPHVSQDEKSEDEPTEEDYLKYINYLGEEKHSKSSTLWNKWSVLNNGHQRHYGKNLRNHAPKVLQLIKNYEYGDVRKDYTMRNSRFTTEQVETALRLKCNSFHMLVNKAAMVIAHRGDLLLKELRHIKLDDVGINEDGVKVRCDDKEFLVPFNRAEPDICFASHIINYIDVMSKSLPSLGPTDALFRAATTNGFRKIGALSVLSRDKLGSIGQEFARQLGLDNPESYCSQSFRVSTKRWPKGEKTNAAKEEAPMIEKRRPRLIPSRRLFRQCKQARGETVDDFIERLKSLAEACAFCNNACLDENVVEQLVEGLRNRDVAQELLDIPDLNLQMAVGICELSNDGGPVEEEEDKEHDGDHLFDAEESEGSLVSETDIFESREEKIEEDCGNLNNSTEDDHLENVDSEMRSLDDIDIDTEMGKHSNNDSDNIEVEADSQENSAYGKDLEDPTLSLPSIPKETIAEANANYVAWLESENIEALIHNYKTEDEDDVKSEKRSTFVERENEGLPNQEGPGSAIVKEKAKKELTSPIQTVAGVPGKSQVTADNIQDTISSALQKEDLSSKHLLEIMQKIVELQKNSLGKKEEGNKVDNNISGKRDGDTHRQAKEVEENSIVKEEEEDSNRPALEVEKVSIDRKEGASHRQAIGVGNPQGNDGSRSSKDKPNDPTNPFSESFAPLRVSTYTRKKKIAPGLSQQSIRSYEFTWKDFQAFINLPENRGSSDHQDEPSEGDYIKYFNFLYEIKRLKTSTLWSVHSRLNYNHQKRFQKNLHELSPKIADHIRTYESLGTADKVKRVEGSIFTREQIYKALKHNPRHPLEPPSSWIMKRAAISIALCGSLNLQELKRIKLGCVKVDEQGVWITNPVNGEIFEGEDDRFLVPFHTSKRDPCPASIVITYLDRLHRHLPELGSGDALFHQARKDDSFYARAIGLNWSLGVKVASMLGLDNPETYSYNCFKLPSESGVGKKRQKDLAPGDMKGITDRHNAKKKRATISSSSETSDVEKLPSTSSSTRFLQPPEELLELSEELPELPEDMQLSDADGEDPDTDEESDCGEEARKTADQIMAEVNPMETNPMKSANLYEVAWNKFTDWRAETSSDPLGRDEFHSLEPKEEEYMRYFHFLKEDKKYQSSTLWNTYSKLNRVHQRRFGKRLQNEWPGIQILLKKFEAGYVRKRANTFTRFHIRQAIALDFRTPMWILRKAAIVMAYCGGLRCVDLHSIKIGDISVNEEGVSVRYNQAKQSGEQKKNNFLVPYDKEDQELCFATQVIQYLNLVHKSQPQLGSNSESPMFLRAKTRVLGGQPMGKEMLGSIGKEVAKELGLDNPDTYTGHCFTNAAPKKRHLGEC